MTNQELAKELYHIDWLKAEADCPYENGKVATLLKQLDKLDKQDAIRLLAHVYRVSQLNHRYPNDNLFQQMRDFRYLDHRIKAFSNEG